jgi:DNA-binding PadR family transcriptional regulator
MIGGPTLSLAERTVLAVLSERPAHGFAVARLTAPDGELGRIWHIPRPVVYRSIGRLLDAGLLIPAAVESGRGPQRTLYTVTAPGRQATERWLDTPVQHVRDVRSQLLLKLALLDRAGRDPTDLLSRQKIALEPIVAAIRSERAAGQGFDRTLLAWRRASAAAALAFLDDITGPVQLVEPDQGDPGQDERAAEELQGGGQLAEQQPGEQDREQHFGHADE